MQGEEIPQLWQVMDEGGGTGILLLLYSAAWGGRSVCACMCVRVGVGD